MKTILKDSIMITVGCFLLAAAINLFLAPNRISAGGISSVGTILLYLFGIKMSLTNIALNIILFVFGFKMLGKYSVVQTIYGILMLSLFLEITEMLPVYNENEMLAALSGGVLMGAGVGLVVKTGASTGGSDFAGLMLKKLFGHISLAMLIMWIDCAVVILSGVVFKSLTVMFYSIMSLFVSSVVADKILTFGDKAKMIQIFSQKPNEISACVLSRYGRGVTGVHSVGMYSQDEKLMLICVVSPKELPKYISMIKQTDPSAFVVVSDVREVMGEGFKKLL